MTAMSDIDDFAGFYATIHSIILSRDITDKCDRAQSLYQHIDALHLRSWETETVHEPAKPIPLAGYPVSLQLVPPRELARRGIQKQSGRNRLMHAIAHIEFNAINLALDAAYRFRDQPPEFIVDWLSVAADEACHFMLIQDYLNTNGCEYGDFPAHNGLWDMVVKTQHDVVARMALVPRVLEARGLDVTPGMITRLQKAGDDKAADILKIIYRDEIGHVEIGSRWFEALCSHRGLEPKRTFKEMIKLYMHGELRGPFNLEARRQAGFSESELADLVARYS